MGVSSNKVHQERKVYSVHQNKVCKICIRERKKSTRYVDSHALSLTPFLYAANTLPSTVKTHYPISTT